MLISKYHYLIYILYFLYTKNKKKKIANDIKYKCILDYEKNDNFIDFTMMCSLFF